MTGLDSLHEFVTHPGTVMGAVIGALFANPLVSPAVTVVLQTANQWFGIAAIFSSTIGPQIAPMFGWLTVKRINTAFLALAVLYVLILARKGYIRIRNR